MTEQTWRKRLQPIGNGGAFLLMPKPLLDENDVKAGDEVTLKRAGTGKVIVDLKGGD